jgi:hypothetical protein
MKFILLVYNDPALLDALPAAEFDSRMRSCFAHVDELQDQGCPIESQQLDAPATARTVRIRNGRTTTTDGPFAETKEVLGGFNIIEAESMEEAVRIAESFPWARTGCIEVRPVLDLDGVRKRVGAERAASKAAG